jgi:anti-sigma factor RsiW
MTCHDVLDLVDAIASGDDVAPELRAHIETCPGCAAALASARRLELALSAREAPEAPATFTAAVSARIRGERWRSEQQVDRLFNLAIAAAILLVVGGSVAIFNVQSVMTVAAGAWSLVSVVTGQAAAQAQPLVATYAAAAGLLVSVMGMWWWAERRLSL